MKKIFTSKYARFGVQGVLGVAALGFLGFQFGCDDGTDTRSSSSECSAVAGRLTVTLTGTYPNYGYSATITNRSSYCGDFTCDINFTPTNESVFPINATGNKNIGLLGAAQSTAPASGNLGVCQANGTVNVASKATCKNKKGRYEPETYSFTADADNIQVVCLPS